MLVPHGILPCPLPACNQIDLNLAFTSNRDSRCYEYLARLLFGELPFNSQGERIFHSLLGKHTYSSSHKILYNYLCSLRFLWCTLASCTLTHHLLTQISVRQHVSFKEDINALPLGISPSPPATPLSPDSNLALHRLDIHDAVWTFVALHFV